MNVITKIVLGAVFCITPMLFAQGSGEECQPCEGQATTLTLEYNGAEEALITITDRRGEITLFEDTVAAGASFTVEGAARPAKGKGKGRKARVGTLGAEIALFIDDAFEASIHTSCSVPLGPGMEFGDFTVTDGASRAGILCDATGETQEDDTTDGTNDVDNCECAGGATELVFQYTGASAEVGIVQRKLGDLLYQGTTATGDIVAVSGTWKSGKLGNEILIFVDGELDQTIHTSCSLPLIVGTQFGDFLLVAGASAVGGTFCNSAIPEPPVVVEPPVVEPPVVEPPVVEPPVVEPPVVDPPPPPPEEEG